MATIAAAWVIAATTALGVADDPPAPLMLVTPEEAALPILSPVASQSEQSDGPAIEIRSPRPGGTYAQSFPVDVAFSAGPSGAAPDLDSLKVVYERAWGIDITSRLRDYVGSNGINVPAADFPSGKHTVRIYLEDLEENASSRRVTVIVTDE